MSVEIPSTYKYYEMGLRPGDFMGILNRVENKCEWAIVYDRSDDKYFKPRYEIYVNGTKVGETQNFSSAEETMRKYMSGQFHIPPC